MSEQKPHGAALAVEKSPLDPSAKRVEIDEFIADHAMTNLFLLALRNMQLHKLQNPDKEDWFSYYNLSGELVVI
jgi:hypothetical protein